MYAVIATGGKQERVEPGQRVRVELLPHAVGDEVVFGPILVVDEGRVVATPDELGQAKVTARILAEVKGPKIRGFTYKPKTNNRRRYGHRQRYHEIEVTAITAGGRGDASEAASEDRSQQEGEG